MTADQSRVGNLPVHTSLCVAQWPLHRADVRPETAAQGGVKETWSRLRSLWVSFMFDAPYQS